MKLGHKDLKTFDSMEWNLHAYTYVYWCMYAVSMHATAVSVMYEQISKHSIQCSRIRFDTMTESWEFVELLHKNLLKHLT